MTEEKKGKLKTVVADDIMTANVVVVKKSMTIGQVAHLMLRERVSGYPVVDEKGGVVGVITITDFFNVIDHMIKQSKTYLDGYEGQALEKAIDQVKNQPIEEIMSKHVIHILPETSLLEIIEKVAQFKVHTFPVMKNNKLVGIVGRHDVLNAAFVYG
jgi:CBS domain-containing protein